MENWKVEYVENLKVSTKGDTVYTTQRKESEWFPTKEQTAQFALEQQGLHPDNVYSVHRVPPLMFTFADGTEIDLDTVENVELRPDDEILIKFNDGKAPARAAKGTDLEKDFDLLDKVREKNELPFGLNRRPKLK